MSNGRSTGMQRGKPQRPAGERGGTAFLQQGLTPFAEALAGIRADIQRWLGGGGPGGAATETAQRGMERAGKAAREQAERALKGISGATDWQEFIRTSLTDIGIYAAFFVMALLGLVFLVSSAGIQDARSGTGELLVRTARRVVAKGKAE